MAEEIKVATVEEVLAPVAAAPSAVEALVAQPEPATEVSEGPKVYELTKNFNPRQVIVLEDGTEFSFQGRTLFQTTDEVLYKKLLAVAHLFSICQR